MLRSLGGGLQYSDRRGSVSLEEIMGDLHATVLGTAVVSSATSWMVLHLVLGDDPCFMFLPTVWFIPPNLPSTPRWE
jgi:hypothetical protein